MIKRESRVERKAGGQSGAKKNRNKMVSGGRGTSERRYLTIAELIRDCTYWQGPDGTLLFVSPSCERITGYLFPGLFIS